jgi:hypothetical protein
MMPKMSLGVDMPYRSASAFPVKEEGMQMLAGLAQPSRAVRFLLRTSEKKAKQGRNIQQ